MLARLVVIVGMIRAQQDTMDRACSTAVGLELVQGRLVVYLRVADSDAEWRCVEYLAECVRMQPTCPAHSSENQLLALCLLFGLCLSAAGSCVEG
jgi:hypothetical protein